MRIEYRVLELGLRDLESWLNVYAKHGWRPWRLVPPRPESGMNYVVIFEREKQYVPESLPPISSLQDKPKVNSQGWWRC